MILNAKHGTIVSIFVIPAEAGIHTIASEVDSRVRGNDSLGF